MNRKRRMSRTFAYARVSTTEQTTENQLQEIEAAGFQVHPRRVVVETISGSSAIEQRKGFVKLLERMESGDILVTTRMDRLGRNAMDVAATVKRLGEAGIKVHCLQLGGADLTSSAGKMIMGMLNTFAEFERDLLIERTKAGLDRAKKAGKALGRKAVLNAEQRKAVKEQIAAGTSVSALAKQLGTSRMTVMRARDGEAAA
jgi:putative DNA-invertase from lambdoid prophage Rac